MTRDEHLQWCKDRAMEYIEAGDPQQALSSMFSDLRKHPETANHSAIEFGAMLMFGGQLSTVEQVREFIQGFN